MSDAKWEAFVGAEHHRIRADEYRRQAMGDESKADEKATAGTGAGDAKAGAPGGASDSGAKAGAAGDAKAAAATTDGGTKAGAAADAAKKGTPLKGVPGLMKAHPVAGWKTTGVIGDRMAAKATGPVSKGVLKFGSRALPAVGSIFAAGAAYNDLKQGDYLGAVFNTIGIVPGPIGWVGLGASLMWEEFGPQPGRYGVWDQPDGTATLMLPGAAKDAAGVQEADAALAAAQRDVFALQDGPLWHGLELESSCSAADGHTRGEDGTGFPLARNQRLVPSDG